MTNPQHVIARGTDPLQSAVLSISEISGGSAPNVIPDSVEFVRTVRVFDEGVREPRQGGDEAGRARGHRNTRGHLLLVVPEGLPAGSQRRGLAAVVEEPVREELGDEALEEM